MTYPSFLGAVSQYGKLSSSRVHIENMTGRNAQVYICNKPSDNSSNGDFLSIDNCHFEYVKHFVSIGTSQGRNFACTNCEGGRIFDCFVNGIHGQQVGQFGGPITNFSAGSFVNRLFHFPRSATIGSSTSFNNVFVENIHRIGDLDGATSGDTPMKFRDCRFNFRWDDTNGVPPNAADFANCTAQIVFDGVAFTGFPDTVKIDGALNAVVKECEMADAEPASATRLVHNATTGGLVFGADPKYTPDLQSVAFSQRALSTGTETRVVADWRLETNGRDYCMPLYLKNACHSNGSTARHPIQQDRPFYRHQVAKGTCWSSASRTNKTITATWTAMSLEELFWEGGYIGDLWIDVNTGTHGYVATAVTNASDVDMTFVLLSNYEDDGASGYNLNDTTFSLTSGNVAFLNTRIWATQGQLWGRTTSGSATLACQSGISTAVATILGDISTAGTINDMLANAHRAPDHFDSATDCEVSSISSPNITMGGNSAESWGNGANDYPLAINFWVRDEV